MFSTVVSALGVYGLNQEKRIYIVKESVNISVGQGVACLTLF